MKFFNKVLKPAAIALAIASGFYSSQAMAITASGTSIANTASLSYTVGGVTQTALASTPATFVVDTIVNMTMSVTSGTYTTVVPNSTSQVTTFTLANTGNSTTNFILTPTTVANGQTVLGKTVDFAATGCAAYQDTLGTGVYNAGSDTQTFVSNLAPATSIKVFVVCNIPATQVNNDFAAVSLTAQASVAGAGAPGAPLTQTAGAKVLGTVSTVFGDGAGSDDAQYDGKISARDGYLVQSSSVTVTKSVAVWCDLINGPVNPKLFPTSFAEYTITVTNSATATASAILGNVTDTLVAQMAYDPNLVQATVGCATPTSAAGKGFKVSCVGGSRACVSTPIYVTTATVVAGQALSLPLSTILPAEGTYAAGQLKPGESVNVIFNAVVQ